MAIATVYGKGPKTEVTASLTMKDYLEVMETSEPGKHYDTDEFMVKETPMRLVVYPNGYSEEFRGGVGVYLANRSQVEVKLKRQFITDVKSSEMEEKTIPAGGMTGFKRFPPHEDAKEHYKEKDFVVKVKVEMEGEVVKVVGENLDTRKRKAIAQEILENAYRKMAWTDFILEFEGEELACHRNILAGASPVFAAMLEPASQFIEAEEGRAVIKLPAAVGRAFLRYIYLEDIEEEILKEEVIAFLELGERYEVEKLKDLAEDRMLQLLDRETMMDFMMAGHHFRAARVKAAALKLARIHLAWLRGEGKDEMRKLDQDLLIEFSLL